MDGMTLYEALDDAAAYLRRDGMMGLARAVEHAAGALGQIATTPARPLALPSVDDELGAGTRRELEAATLALDEILAHGRDPRDQTPDMPKWATLAQIGFQKLSDAPPTRSSLVTAYDTLSIIRHIPGAPPAVVELVDRALQQMPRAVRLFGPDADVAPPAVGASG